MEYFISVNKESEVIGLSETPVFLDGADTFKIDLASDHAMLNDLTGWFYKDGILVFNEEVVLNTLKAQKVNYFRKVCQDVIENGFDHVIGGTTYHFSLDTEAQQNFSDSYQLLKDNVIEEVVWTVTVNGEYSRCVIDLPIMTELTKVIFAHKTQNIAKLRDFLQPLIMGCATVAELESIEW